MFEPFEVADQIPDLTWIQPKLGHILMAGDNAFTERFFKRFHRIAVLKLPKRRRQLERACADLVDRMTARAICLRQGQTPLLPGIHLRVSARDKNQIANSERQQTGGYMSFFKKLYAHGSTQ